jgi:hypothetical protein
MGIQGLWKLLEPSAVDVPLWAFKQDRLPIGVDGLNILHGVTRQFAVELARGDWVKVAKAISRKFIALQKRCDVQFKIVFDGMSPPMKSEEVAKRDNEREVYRSIGVELLTLGGENQLVRDVLAKAPVISRYIGSIAHHLQNHGLDVQFAPYEAEAQLAYLSREGYLSAVWTGDCDVFMYGCGVVIRDVDFSTCTARVFHPLIPLHRSWLPKMPVPYSPLLCELATRPDAIALACVLAGGDFACDVGSGAAGNMIKLVHQVQRKQPAVGFVDLLRAAGSALRLSQDAAGAVHRAVYAVVYHWVYDPLTHRCVHNNTPPAAANVDLSIVGAVPDELLHARCSATSGWRRALEGTVDDPRESPVSLVAEFLADPVALAFRPLQEPTPPVHNRTWCAQCGVGCDGPIQIQIHHKSLRHTALLRLSQLRSDQLRPVASTKTFGQPVGTPAVHQLTLSPLPPHAACTPTNVRTVKDKIPLNGRDITDTKITETSALHMTAIADRFVDRDAVLKTVLAHMRARPCRAARS